MVESVDERLKEITQALESYEKTLNMPPPVSPLSEEEVQHFFTMSRDEIEAMSSSQCAAVAYQLAQYGLYIQRMSNRERSRVTWAENSLKAVIAKSLDSYSQYMKHEAKVELICCENESARKLKNVISYSEQRFERLTYTAQGIKYLADIMINNQRAKHNV